MKIGGPVTIRIGKDRMPMLGRLVSVDLPSRTGIVSVRNVEFKRDLRQIYNEKLANQSAASKMKRNSGK